jgi:xanthine dehydrogenase molybdopterin-binding subunit B
MEENRIVLVWTGTENGRKHNLETTRLTGMPRNRWQNEVREDGGIVGGEEWQEKAYNRQELKKLL